MRPPGGHVVDGGRAPPLLPSSVQERAEHVPVAQLPGAHGVAGGLRRRGRRHDVQHGGIPFGGGPPVAVLRRGRRHAVRAGGEVADGALQPDEPLHALPAQRRRHPGIAGYRRVAGDRPPPFVRARPGQGRRSVREPDRRVEPDGRGGHRRQWHDRRAGRGVVVQVPQQQAQVHAGLPDRGAVVGHGGGGQRDAAQLAGVEHPPGVQPQHRGAGRHDPGADAVPQHGRHQPGLVRPRPHPGLLRRLRRRLRGHQERLGRVRHPGRHAQRAHRRPPPHLRVAHQRRHRARQRDVGRHPGRARRGHRRRRLRVGRADQDRRGAGRLRARRVRAADDAPDHEVGVLDDGQLQVPPGRRLRPERGARGGGHQLPGRGGDGGVQGGGAPRGHPGRALPGHLPRQRHGRARQIEEVPLDLHRRRGRVGQRHPAAVRGAAAERRRRRRRRLPLPDGHAAHRPAHPAALRLRRPEQQQLAAAATTTSLI